MTPPPDSHVPVFHADLGGKRLTPKQWAAIEKLLDEWKVTVLQAAKRHPARSFKLGVQQIEAFADLLGGLQTSAPAASMFGGLGPSQKAAEQWMRTYTLRELEDALNVYVGRIKDALLYGLRSGMNSAAIGQLMYKATQDATVNWRMIARTEAARANAMGRLHACRAMGFDRVWCPPHIGSCNQCKRLLEGQVFSIDQVEHATNYGRTSDQWVPCIPLHPNCRHGWLPYDEEVHGYAMQHYQAMDEAGLTNEAYLNELFDSSGQLKPEHADIDLSAAKTQGGQLMDLYAEGLAIAVEKVARDRSGRFNRTPNPRHLLVDVDDLRVDLYQRAMEPDKVWSMRHALLRGEPLGAPEVSEREDGTFWVMDGQHRVEARKLAGEHQVLCRVEQGLSWDQESARCRAAIAKAWNYLSDPLPPLHDGDQSAIALPVSAADAVAQMLGNEQAAPSLDPLLFDGARLRDDIGLALEAWWAHVAGPDWRAYSHLYVPAWGGPVRVTLDFAALRAARPEWAKLADDDLHFALVLAARGAGAQGPAELAPGLPMDVRIEPDQWLHTDIGPAWHVGDDSWTGDVDALPVGKSATSRFPDIVWWTVRDDLVAKTPTVGWHVAPAAAREAILEHGLIEAQPNERWKRYGAAEEPAGIYVWTEQPRAMKWARDLARLVGHTDLAANDVWQIDLTGLQSNVHVDPVLGDEGAIYLTLPAIAPNRLSLSATKTDGELLDVTKAEQAANVGVEHWITVHPHGPGAEGQPVLVRNNSDGTMSVIGGAGGNLNYLRLDPSRRVDRQEGTKGRDKPAQGIEQPVSEEEADRAQAEREQQLSDARGALAEAQQHKADADAALHDFAKTELGIDLHADDIDPKARRKLLAKLRVSAMRTLTYGEVQASTRGEDGQTDTPDATPPRTDDELADQQHQSESDGSPEAEDGIERPKRPSMAMTAEQASALLDHFLQVRAIQRVASQHRRVIAGEKPPSDANQIDWSLGGQAQRDERRAKALESFARTELAQDLLGRGDAQFKGKKGYDTRYRQSFLQGGYDSIDSFAHSILGHNLLSRHGHDLLGVAGAAQLAAHAIQTEAMAKGKQTLDLEQVGKALADLTDDQERAVADRGIGRIKRATELAATAQLELAKSERGEGLFTTTMARSLATTKVQEAKRSLGMMIGGLEATSALKMALERPVGEKIKVGGFSTPSQAKEAAAKAGVKLRADEVVRVGSGNYTLNIAPDRLMGLVRPDKQADQGLRERLRAIRTGKDLDGEIEASRRGPLMADELDSNQAKGKMALLAAGSHLLGFDPGVGKTHTAIAAACEQIAQEGLDSHKGTLIVAPTNMLGSWRDTIQAQHAGLKVATADGSRKQKLGALTDQDAHFTIVSYETLKGFRNELKAGAADGTHRPHKRVITDELQKAKNDDTANYAGVETAVDLAAQQHGASQPDGQGASFWGLTGTPIEKDVSDLNSMRSLVARARGGEGMDRSTARRKYGKLGQDEHIARGDKVAQFRDSLDADLFRLSAADAGNDLGEPTRSEHSAPLTDEHQASFQARVKGLNDQIADYHARSEKNGGDGGGTMPAFGGRAALMDELYGREDSSLVKECANQIAKSGTFEFGGMPNDGRTYGQGDHAGTYEHKHVVFGANETSKALFGKGWNKPGAKVGGLHGELAKQGVKVFVGHGSMSSAQNEANYKAFLAHKGKAVFLTNDKNNAGISLQFGDNKGAFQHGATHLHHFTRPVNNATIQQREARILRKGATAGAHYHTYNAGTPLELQLQETLEREGRTQDLAANAEQRVAGADTLRHHLAGRGVDASGR